MSLLTLNNHNPYHGNSSVTQEIRRHEPLDLRSVWECDFFRPVFVNGVVALPHSGL